MWVFFSVLQNIFTELSSLFFYFQASRNSAEGRGLFPQPHATDESSVCQLLLQPSLCGECAHTAQVREQRRYTKAQIQTLSLLLCDRGTYVQYVSSDL